MKKLLALLLCGLMHTAANAAMVNVTGKIQMLNSWERHGGLLVKMKAEDMRKTEGMCERNDYYILVNAHRYMERNFSMMLSARIAEKPITLRFSDDATNKCVERFPRIFHIAL